MRSSTLNGLIRDLHYLKTSSPDYFTQIPFANEQSRAGNESQELFWLKELIKSSHLDNLVEFSAINDELLFFLRQVDDFRHQFDSRKDLLEMVLADKTLPVDLYQLRDEHEFESEDALMRSRVRYQTCIKDVEQARRNGLYRLTGTLFTDNRSTVADAFQRAAAQGADDCFKWWEQGNATLLCASPRPLVNGDVLVIADKGYVLTPAGHMLCDDFANILDRVACAAINHHL